MEELKSNIQKIKDLKVQGATNVAKFGLNFFNKYIQSVCKDFKEKSAEFCYDKIEEASFLLNSIRPTEPCLRNGLRYIINKAKKNEKILSMDDIAEDIDRNIKVYIKLLEEATKKIGIYGARRIIDGSTILTHCHSGSVFEILKCAYQDGKKIEVIATETRPLYQGRKTVQRLLNVGIKTRMIVDSGMRWIVMNKDVDLIIIGADAITVEGTVLNKIGSRLLALVAQENHIPFYIASTMLKYNPESEFGNLEAIEMRSEDEVWDPKNRPKGLRILNPAFETINRRYISALITEIGVFPPVLISEKFENEYPYLKLD